MRTSKLTVTMLFVASMAWASSASAEEPCGAPADSFTSCEIVQAPDCYDLCQPDAMAVACVADNVDQCLAECAGPGEIACDSTCEQQCGNTCTAALVQEQPQDCKISCGASCMGECGAACEASDDKVGCFAACGQQCGAHCELSCDGGALVLDSGENSYQENWGRYDDDDDDRKRWDDDDDRKRWDDDDDRRRWDDDDDRKRWDDDDDYKSEIPVSDGLDIDQGPAALVQEEPQDCVISCGASCMGECGAGCEVAEDKASCFAACGQQCSAACQVSCSEQETDGLDIDQGPAALVTEKPEECKISCGAGCMGECGAGCEVADDKASCFAACGQQCSAACELTCSPAPQRVDNGDDYDQALEQSSIDDITSDCQQNCQQSCSGACEAGNARSCELGCQTDSLSVCRPHMASFCADQCERGAVLLCDGQYLNVRDVNACAVELEQVGVPLTGPVAAFNGDEALEKALPGASCSVHEPNNLRLAGGLFALLGLGLGASFLRRRRS